MKTYLHTVHRASGSFRRVFLGDAILEFKVGAVSRRCARRIAARERHAENCFQSRKRALMAQGHSEFTAEVLALAHRS